MQGMVLNEYNCLINDRYKIVEIVNQGKYSLLYRVQDLNEDNKT